jgi:hypothetical protein
MPAFATASATASTGGAAKGLKLKHGGQSPLPPGEGQGEGPLDFSPPDSVVMGIYFFAGAAQRGRVPVWLAEAADVHRRDV